MSPIHAKVLAVAATARSRQKLRELLNELMVFQIDEVSDGRAALALHQTGGYDLILAEWDLPQLSGVQLLRTIRAGASASQTPVVLMAGDKLGARTVEAVQSGANGILELPLDPQRAREKIRRVMGTVPEHFGRGAARAADLWSPQP